jgi:predicted kinase
MNRPQSALVIVCGLPATGKTTLATALREELGWPLLAKDRLKELLHDTGMRDDRPFDRAQSRALGRQAMFLLYALVRDVAGAGAPCIVEANFMPGLAEAELRPLLDIARVRQVHCAASGEVILMRYRARFEAGGRHPVHLDLAVEDELATRIDGEAAQPLALDCPLLKVETDNGWNPGFPEIAAFCRS